MKQKFKLIAAVLLAVVCVASLAACDLLSGLFPSGKTTVPLDKPFLEINNTTKTASWPAVDDAKENEGYTIKIGNNETPVTGTSYPLTDLAAGTYSVSVKANGYETDTHIYKASAYSEVKTYTSTNVNPTPGTGTDPNYQEPAYPTATAPVTAGLQYTYVPSSPSTIASYWVGKGTVNSGDVVIPPTYNGTNGDLPVTGISNGAFANTQITSVYIPEGVKSIGGTAFQNCTQLTQVTIPASVQAITSNAFVGCSASLSITWYYPNPYPSGFSFDNNNPFQHAPKVTEVIFPAGVTTIVTQAFVGFSGLESIVIPVTITSINQSAFAACINLTTVYYTGNETQWTALTAAYAYNPSTQVAVGTGAGNQALLDAAVYYFSATQPTAAGNYWHYVGGVPTAW